MTTSAFYQTWIVLFRRIKFFGGVVMLLGTLAGFMAHDPARTVIWIVSGLVGIWLYVAGTVEQKRYQRFLDQIKQDESDPKSTSLKRPRPKGSPINGGQRDQPLEPSPSEPPSLDTNARDNQYLSALRRYERFFAILAMAGVAVMAASIAIGLLFSDGIRATIIGGLGAGSLWIAAMSLVMRKRIRTGPKAH